MTRVSTASGRYVFRACFGDSTHPRGEVVERLEELGALVEWSSAKLLAIDASDRLRAQQVADLLLERGTLGHLIYEAGKSS